MDKIKKKRKSIKKSMAATFIFTICIVGILSGITIFLANQAQQEIIQNQFLSILSPDFQKDENTGEYRIDIDENNFSRKRLSFSENIAYYSCYVAMIGLPILYIILGTGIAAAIYYRMKLRTPITQLRQGMKRIEDNDLDFHIEYHADDELGELCSSMEKMRKDLRYNSKALWEALAQRKLLNSSVSHDLRTPLTVLRGYLDYLEKNIPQDKLTEDVVMETLGSMQGAVSRLERYVDCVRDVEKLESIEVKCKAENTTQLISELRSNSAQLIKDKELVFTSDISLDTVYVDRDMLFRIIENLLHNSLRYASKQISVDVSSEDKWLIISVKDDGKGFTDTELTQATTWFYSNDKKNEHFGIGLSVCKLLCEKQGGSLHISNNTEAGACVTAVIKIL